MLQLHFFIFGNNWPILSSNLVLSIFNSANHSFSFNDFLELVEADLFDLIGLHGLLNESLHFVSLLNRGFVLWCISSLLNKEVLVDLIS